jgi:hypothetical protein
MSPVAAHHALVELHRNQRAATRQGLTTSLGALPGRQTTVGDAIALAEGGRAKVLTLARRAFAVCVTLVLIEGVSLVGAQERPESRRQEKWRLSWNIVDRGFVSWGAEAHFTSREDCLAAQGNAVQHKMAELQSRGNDVTENNATIVEKHREGRAVLSVVRFSCTEENDWIIVIAHQPRRGPMSEDRFGLFFTEEKCIDALEVEVDFKAKSLQKLGHAVSAMRLTTKDWILTTTEETGQPRAITTYRCVAR